MQKGGVRLRPTVFCWGQPEQYGNYRTAVERAGGRTLQALDPLAAERCDALLLPGGGDVEPWRYGQTDTASRGLEPERDRAELALLEQFTAAGKPVLGICRGMQVINVFFGGTLIQDLPGHGQVRGADRLHPVRTGASPLRGLWGEGVIVNSAHHQAVARLGAGLEAAQWAPDGTVEALFCRKKPVWGVQWHPERLAGALAVDGTAEGERLFRAWLDLCR